MATADIDGLRIAYELWGANTRWDKTPPRWVFDLSMEKFEVTFPEKWDEPTPSQALRYVQREIERLGLK
ncbi:MAG: hypothetical protein ABSH29_25625 [Acidimicrobiales bacterium]|jgi:hypothetical protein